MGLLYDKASELTKDENFKSPKDKSMLRDPAPSRALRRLGLDLKDGSSMIYKSSDNTFTYFADEAGQEAFVKLNETLKISIKKLPQ